MGKDVLVGDGQNFLSAHMGGCPACQTGVRSHLLQAARVAESRTRFAEEGGKEERLGPSRGRRSTGSLRPAELVEDGYLDPESNYTAFVELIIPDSDLVGRSPYMSPRRPGESVESVESSRAGAVMVLVVGVLAGLILVALCHLVALVLLKRYSKKVAATQGKRELFLLINFCGNCTKLLADCVRVVKQPWELFQRREISKKDFSLETT